MGYYQENLDHTLFSWSAQSAVKPIHAVSANGVFVTDAEGKDYLDFSAQLMNANVGHNHPTVNKAITDQLNKLAFVFPGMATDPRGKLGKKLADMAPGDLNKTFFTNGGADAIENAIKMARLVTGRHKIIAKYRSYHGATYGAISAGGDPRKLPVDRDGMPSIVHVEDPYCYRCPFGQKVDSCQRECVSHMERVIQFEGPQNIAAILLEGESGSSGCIKYPDDYWPKVREIADRYGILLISDEVMSGFGRCGEWFAVQRFGVTPDMICFAKGVTSGYVPLGGVIVSEKVSKHFDHAVLPLGLTYSGHALACAAALGCIDVYESENLLDASIQKGNYIARKMDELKKKHPSIGDYRSTGLLGCIELVKNRDTKEPLVPWNAKSEDMKVSTSISAKLRELGMHTFVRWNYIFIAPPLIITNEEIDQGLEMIDQALEIADREVV